jgi:heme exporter protein D
MTALVMIISGGFFLVVLIQMCAVLYTVKQKKTLLRQVHIEQIKLRDLVQK